MDLFRKRSPSALAAEQLLHAAGVVPQPVASTSAAALQPVASTSAAALQPVTADTLQQFLQSLALSLGQYYKQLACAGVFGERELQGLHGMGMDNLTAFLVEDVGMSVFEARVFKDGLDVKYSA